MGSLVRYLLVMYYNIIKTELSRLQFDYCMVNVLKKYILYGELVGYRI